MARRIGVTVALVERAGGLGPHRRRPASVGPEITAGFLPRPVTSKALSFQRRRMS